MAKKLKEAPINDFKIVKDVDNYRTNPIGWKGAISTEEFIRDKGLDYHLGSAIANIINASIRTNGTRGDRRKKLKIAVWHLTKEMKTLELNPDGKD